MISVILWADPEIMEPMTPSEAPPTRNHFLPNRSLTEPCGNQIMSKDRLEFMITHEDWAHGKAEKEVAIRNPRSESSIGGRFCDSGDLEFDGSIRLSVMKDVTLASLIIEWGTIRTTYGVGQRGTNISHRKSKDC